MMFSRKLFKKGEEMDLKEKARKLMLRNYELGKRQYIAPDKYHNDQWLWDSCFHAIVCAEVGLKDLAKNEIERLLECQKEDGWIPHQIYAPGPRGKKFDIERYFYKREHYPYHSSIAPPPVLAQAVEAINEPEWAEKILLNLLRFYDYYREKRDPDKDNLISICHPCESRDTAPEFDFFRWGAEKKGPFELRDVKLFLLSLWWLEIRYKMMGWKIEKIWQKDLFNVEDLMTHCIWVDGLRSLYRLFRGENSLGENSLADRAEKAVYELCWDEKDRIFYSLDSKHQKIRRKTVACLFPLILDNIPEEMHQSLVMEHLLNGKEFWTPYPIPTVALNDPSFDPAGDFYCNWRGPTWVNMNWFIVRGLLKHGYFGVVREICERTIKIVGSQGFCEFYNPLTGKGLRKKTHDFGWSALAVTFFKFLEAIKKN